MAGLAQQLVQLVHLVQLVQLLRLSAGSETLDTLCLRCWHRVLLKAVQLLRRSLLGLCSESGLRDPTMVPFLAKGNSTELICFSFSARAVCQGDNIQDNNKMAEGDCPSSCPPAEQAEASAPGAQALKGMRRRWQQASLA